MPIEVQHLDRWQAGITQAGTQCGECWGTQKFKGDGSCVYLLLHLVEQFTGDAAWIDEFRVIGPGSHQQDAQRRLKGGRKGTQFVLRQSADHRHRIARTQHEKPLLIVEQFPRQAQRPRDATDDTYLSLLSRLQ